MHTIHPPRAPVRIGVDIGGTFTDLVLVGADGALVTHKTASNPADPSEALFRGLAELAARLQLSSAELCARTAHFIHGTTVATNTLLQRNGAKTVLLVTAGFRDSLELRRGVRDNVWDHRTPWAPVLVPRYLRLPVRERVSAAGEVLMPLESRDLEAAAEVFQSESVEAVAICFLHAYRNPQHEMQARDIMRKLLPEAFVCASHEVAPVVGEFERSSTVVVNACIANRVVPYLRTVRERLQALGLRSEPYFVQSSGGVISFERLQQRPAVLALSGPAAGANSLRAYASSMRDKSVVAIEVGGTSCDVTVMEDATVAERTSFRIGDDVIALPAVDIHTIALGGGTIAGVDAAGLLFVGPHGAGARPGPAAFGLGGRAPTLTDAHVVLGRLCSGRYAGGALNLDAHLAQEAIDRVVAKPLSLSIEDAAIAIVRLGEQQIRHAVERVTLERGQSPAHITLLAGGGAGPLHAAAVARAMGCAHVFVPRLAGVFCAFGMCNAQVRHDWVRDIGLTLAAPAVRAVEIAAEALKALAIAQFIADGFKGEDVSCALSIDLRYLGQSASLNIAFANVAPLETEIRSAFEARHVSEFGFMQPGGSIDVAAVRLISTAHLGRTDLSRRAPSVENVQPVGLRRVWIDSRTGWQRVSVFDGDQLTVGAQLLGPALIEDAAATTLVGAGDRVSVDDAGNLHIDVMAGVA
ncbi:MAG: hydantoinase/oxoprolinase family protein [Gammaproteobacteria bacterium]